MIWFNIRALETKIREGRLTEKDGFNYLLALTLFGLIYNMFAGSSATSSHAFIASLAFIGITLFCLPLLFKINQSADGKDFLKRWVAISFIVEMRLLLIQVAALFFILNIVDLSSPDTTTNLIFSLYAIAMHALHYWLVIRSFKRLSLGTE